MTTRTMLGWVWVALSFGCVPSGAGDDSESAAVTSATPLTIVSAVGHKCLADKGGVIAIHNPLDISPCDGSAGQKWTYENGTLVGIGGMCANVNLDIQANGTAVSTVPCNGTAAQQWTFSGTSIKSAGGYCLTVQNGVNANGTPLQLGSCVANDAAQTWHAYDVVATGPAAPTHFIETGATQSSISLAWSLSTSSDVLFYLIYRNGTLYAESTTTATGPDGKLIGTFTDPHATNAVAPQWTFPPTTYTYAVTAVDAQGRQSAKQSNLTYWMYNTDLSVDINPTPGNTNPGVNGNMNFVNAPGVAGPSGLSSIPGNFVQANEGCSPFVDLFYDDTSGDPLGSPFDFKFTACGFSGLASGPPTVPEYALDLSAYNFMRIDIKPMKATPLRLFVYSRSSLGVEWNEAGVELSTGLYGPLPVIGQWATYKIPLKDLQIGRSTFVGSISGNVLTVTSNPSGVDVVPGGWVSGGGLAAPVQVDCDANVTNASCMSSPVRLEDITSTPILRVTGEGSTGTYGINGRPATPISNATFTFQRTNMMMFNLLDESGSYQDFYYLNNIGWSVD